MNANLHVWSASCAWHGKIEEANGFKGSRPPGCPYCGSVLFQTEEDSWWEGAKKHEQKGHQNYVEFLHWLQRQKRCYSSLRIAHIDFNQETGKLVVFDL